MASGDLVQVIGHYQRDIEKICSRPERALKYEERLLHCVNKLHKLPITVNHLQQTGVGKTVNGLRKIKGVKGIHEAAKGLVAKWKNMVLEEDAENERQEEQKRNEEREKAKKQKLSNDVNGDNDDVTYVPGSGSSENEDEKPRKSSKKENAPSYSTDYVPYMPESGSSENGDSDRTKKQKSRKEYAPSHTSEDNDYGTYMPRKTDVEDIGKNKKHKSSKSSKREYTPAYSNDDNAVTYRPGSGTSENNMYSPQSVVSQHSETNYVPSTKSSEPNGYSPSSSSSNGVQVHYCYSPSKKSESSNEDGGYSPSKASDHVRKEKKRKVEKEKSSSRNEEEKSSKHRSNRESSSRSSEKSKKESNDKTSSSGHHSSSHKSSKDKSSSDSKHKSSSDSKHKSSSDSKHKSSSDSKQTTSSDSKHTSSSDSKSSSSKSKHHSQSSSSGSSKSSKEKATSDEEEVNTQAGGSFADALGPMLVFKSSSPSKKKSRTAHTESKASSSGSSKTTPAASADQLLDDVAGPSHLAPLELDIVSTLSVPNPNYRPMPQMPMLPAKVRAKLEDDALTRIMSNKNSRTKVYSGTKAGLSYVPSLYECCCRVLQQHIDALEYTGGIPYDLLKPVLDGASPSQLYQFEHFNPYIICDTDHLWEYHVKKEFRGETREEFEGWREMYLRCVDQREERYKAVTANIQESLKKSVPVRQTKLAYVDVAKPPRNILRKQMKNGTGTPNPKPDSSKLLGKDNPDAVPIRPTSRIGAPTRDMHIPTFKPKPKVAPLMQKTLKSLKQTRFKR